MFGFAKFALLGSKSGLEDAADIVASNLQLENGNDLLDEDGAFLLLE